MRRLAILALILLGLTLQSVAGLRVDLCSCPVQAEPSSAGCCQVEPELPACCSGARDEASQDAPQGGCGGDCGDCLVVEWDPDGSLLLVPGPVANDAGDALRAAARAAWTAVIVGDEAARFERAPAAGAGARRLRDPGRRLNLPLRI